MTIRPGEPWGTPEPAPPETKWFSTDRELGRALDAGASGPLGVRGGDLVVVTGQPAATAPLKISIDALVVRAVEHTTGLIVTTHAVSSMRLGTWWSRGGMTVVSSTGLVEGIEWFPRAHPHDGLCHGATLAGDMSLRQRMLARRRMASGQPFAHPQIRLLRGRDFHWTGHPTRLMVDGELLARVTSVAVEVLTDATVIYVGSPSTAG